MYKRITQGGYDIGGVLFFGFENGVPVATGIGFKAALSPSGSIRIDTKRISCPGADCPQGVYVFNLGSSDAITRFVATTRQPALDPADLVRLLIKLEIADKPNEVQPPIDIIRVDADGPRWLSRKSECPDLQKQDKENNQ